MGTPGVKYEIIYEAVSRSEYYRLLDAAGSRKVRDEQDREDCSHCQGLPPPWIQKGAQGIYMRLLHEEPPIRMNVKKIRRIMKKFGLFCPIRKANPIGG